MKTLMLLGAALWALPAYAGNVVKTLSGVCGEEPSFRGSGIEFVHDGAAYVVTSEHVLVQSGGAGICQAVQGEDGVRAPAELVAADWGTGLGLLRITGTAAAGLPDLSAISASNLDGVGDGVHVVVAGFPYRSTVAYRDARGAVLRLRSDRHLLPLVPTAIEIVGAHGEFGMSGGPVTGLDGRLLGLLSHQILHLTEGGDTRVESPEQADGRDYNQLLAIPVDFVEAWVKKALVPGYEAGFVREASSELARQLVVVSAGLTFRAAPAPKLFTALVARAGGEDGAGIGGQPEPEGSVEVHVAAASDALPTAWPLRARQSLLADWTKFALSRAQVRVPYLLERRDGELRKVYFSSLEGFFQLLGDPGISVPTFVDGGTAGDLGERIRKIHGEGVKLSAAITAIERAALSPRGKALLARLQLIAELSAGENWGFLSKEDLQRVRDTNGAFQDSWRELFSSDFDDSVEVLRSLNTLGCLIGYSC